MSNHEPFLTTPFKNIIGDESHPMMSSDNSLPMSITDMQFGAFTPPLDYQFFNFLEPTPSPPLMDIYDSQGETIGGSHEQRDPESQHSEKSSSQPMDLTGSSGGMEEESAETPVEEPPKDKFARLQDYLISRFPSFKEPLPKIEILQEIASATNCTVNQVRHKYYNCRYRLIAGPEDVGGKAPTKIKKEPSQKKQPAKKITGLTPAEKEKRRREIQSRGGVMTRGMMMSSPKEGIEHKVESGSSDAMALDSSPQSEGGLDSSWIGGPYQDEVYLALKSMLPSAGGFVARSIKRMHSDAKISRRLPTILPAIQQTGCLTPDFIYFWNGFIEFFLQLKLHLDAMNGSELSRNFTLAKSRRSFLRSQQDTFNTLPFVLKLKSLLHADDFYEINIFYEELESALQLEFQNAMKK